MVYLLYPSAAVGLDVPDEIGQCYSFWERHKNMHMVFHSANFHGYCVHFTDDATDILEYSRQIVLTHGNTRAFDVENEMNIYFY